MPIRDSSAPKRVHCFRALCRIVEIACTIAELRALPPNLTVKRCRNKLRLSGMQYMKDAKFGGGAPIWRFLNHLGDGKVQFGIW